MEHSTRKVPDAGPHQYETARSYARVQFWQVAKYWRSRGVNYTTVSLGCFGVFMAVQLRRKVRSRPLLASNDFVCVIDMSENAGRSY